MVNSSRSTPGPNVLERDGSEASGSSPLVAAQVKLVPTPETAVDGLLVIQDVPVNSKGFNYTPCGPSPVESPVPALPFFRPVPYPSPAPSLAPHFSTTDRNALMRISPDFLTCSAGDGWRSIRCNTPVREGSYYFEFEIELAGVPEDEDMGAATHIPAGGGGGVAPAVRVGVGRREATLGWPVGGDGYSYGFRDRGGEKIWLGKVQAYHARSPGESAHKGFRTGDVVGCWINIPPPPTPSAAASSAGTPVSPHDTAQGSSAPHVVKRYEFDAAGRPFLAEVPPPSPLPADDDQKPSLEPDRTPSFDAAALKPESRTRIPIHYKGQSYFEARNPPLTKEMEVLMDPPPAAAAPVPALAAADAPVAVKKGKGNRITNKTLPSSDEMLRASLTVPLRPLPTLPGSTIEFFVNGMPLGPAFTDLLDFRPLAVPEEEAKKGRKKKPAGAAGDADDGSLGYFPMVSCFGGGRVKFNAGPDFRYPPAALSTLSSSSTAIEPPVEPFVNAYTRYTEFQRELDELAEVALARRWAEEAEEEEERERQKAETDAERRRVRAEQARARAAKGKGGEGAADVSVKDESSPAASSIEPSPSPAAESALADASVLSAPMPSAPAAGKKRARPSSTGASKGSSSKAGSRKALPKSKLGVAIKAEEDASHEDGIELDDDPAPTEASTTSASAPEPSAISQMNSQVPHVIQEAPPLASTSSIFSHPTYAHYADQEQQQQHPSPYQYQQQPGHFQQQYQHLLQAQPQPPLQSYGQPYGQLYQQQQQQQHPSQGWPSQQPAAQASHPYAAHLAQSAAHHPSASPPGWNITPPLSPYGFYPPPLPHQQQQQQQSDMRGQIDPSLAQLGADGRPIEGRDVDMA